MQTRALSGLDNLSNWRLFYECVIDTGLLACFQGIDQLPIQSQTGSGVGLGIKIDQALQDYRRSGDLTPVREAMRLAYGEEVYEQALSEMTEEQFVEAADNVRVVLEYRNNQRSGDSLFMKDISRDVFREALRLEPLLGIAHYNLGVLYATGGRREEARAQLDQVIHARDLKNTRAFRGFVAASTGDTTQAREDLSAVEEWSGPYLHGLPLYWQASITGALGDLDRAMELLRQAHSEGLRITDLEGPPTEMGFFMGYGPFLEFMRPRG